MIIFHRSISHRIVAAVTLVNKGGSSSASCHTSLQAGDPLTGTSYEVEVTLRLTVSQSVSMFRCRANSGTCDQMLLPVGRLLSETCSIVYVGRPLLREDGSAVCSAITQWSASHRTRNHTLFSHLRLPQPGKPESFEFSLLWGGGATTSKTSYRLLWPCCCLAIDVSCDFTILALSEHIPRNFSKVMESKSSLLCSRVPATGPCLRLKAS
jgi:hypothetical protein